jgi:4-deoxy-L-threo-5-hexosulose-uronate ketol-isomerase
MLTVETRHAVSAAEARGMDTAALRAAFALTGLFAPGAVRLTYTHYDRMMIGGAVPDGATLTLDAVAECGTASWLDRREAVIVNIGADAAVEAEGARHALPAGAMLYLPMGSGPVAFHAPGRFYILSAPAHARHPARVVTLADAVTMRLGSAEAANARTINQLFVPEVAPTCQLVVGMTRLDPGSVWNTMPTHTHDRRMEAYLYLDLPAEARVMHLMGEPTETRHLILGNEEGAVSPPWSIHAGAGTSAYAFIWAMAGDNVNYRDMDMVAMDALR